MGEDPAKLIHKYVGVDEANIEEGIGATTIGVFHLKDCSSADEDIGVVLEGIRVLSNLDSVPTAVAMLFGLIYAMNLAYPADLRYTFEVLQKIVMELDGGKLSNKALSLKNHLYE
uniref:Uncharacterized LOC111607926 n=2 Tax=Xiphophorus maculatus TaxID=8083 RepID=A0A3B5RD75_XIPMA